MLVYSANVRQLTLSPRLAPNGHCSAGAVPDDSWIMESARPSQRRSQRRVDDFQVNGNCSLPGIRSPGLFDKSNITMRLRHPFDMTNSREYTRGRRRSMKCAVS